MTTDEIAKKRKKREKWLRQKKKVKALKAAKKHNIEIAGKFTLVKDVIPFKPEKIGRVLPDWLSNPVLIRDLQSKFKTPKDVCPILNPDIIWCLKSNKITNLFPVQEALIPQILSGCHGFENRFPPRDICVCTPTGSGKTLAFVIPIVQALGKRYFHSLSAVVILPGMELARQVYEVFNLFSKRFNLIIGKAFQDEYFIDQQNNLVTKVFDSYYSKVDVLVATPGRLINHMNETSGLDFTQVRFLVLDEADKLLAGENGYFIKRILNHILKFKSKTTQRITPFIPLKKSCLDEPSHPLMKVGKCFSLFSRPFKRKVVELEPEEEMDETEYFTIPSPPLQKLLFSATLTHDPEQLQNISLFKPILFASGKGDEDKNKDVEIEMTRPSELCEEYVKTDERLKPLVLHYILQKERKKTDNFQALIFTRSVELTSKVAIILKEMSKDKYVVQEFSAKIFKERKKTLAKFLNGKIHVLVSTDAMSRGIDVPNVDCVISYDVPSSITYTHRIGRTARAGKPGKAISIVTVEEYRNLWKTLGKNFKNISERIVKENKLEKYEARFKVAVSALSKASKRDPRHIKIKKTLKRKNFQGKKNVKNKS